jgi:hypothetical protein
MKKLLLVLLLVPLVSFGQNEWIDGYENGFKNGYCVGEIGCLSPVPPFKVNNSIEHTYQDGYNQGVVDGNKARQKQEASNKVKRIPLPKISNSKSKTSENSTYEFKSGIDAGLANNYMNPTHSAGDVAFINKSLFDALIVNYDIEMTGVTQKFRAISASTSLAKSLDIEVGAPVLEIIRKLSTNKQGFHVYSFTYCNTDEFTIET